MVRKPFVAGMFYEDEFERLDEQIKNCFSSKLGPGLLQPEKREKEIIGIIAPHAGYAYSGACAASAFNEISKAMVPDVFVIIGLSHSGFPSAISLEDWETPFGIVKNDVNFCKALIKNTGIANSEDIHKNEHSLEVMLPFLQFVNKDKLHDIKIAPVIVSHDIEYSKVAKAIVNTLKEARKKAIFIASSDFTHYGINYGYFPFKDNIKQSMGNLDRKAIEHIINMDSYKFLSYIEETGTTICGFLPIAAAIEIAKLLGSKNVKLLQYYTSGDITNDYSSAVGYASILFE